MAAWACSASRGAGRQAGHVGFGAWRGSGWMTIKAPGTARMSVAVVPGIDLLQPGVSDHQGVIEPDTGVGQRVLGGPQQLGQVRRAGRIGGRAVAELVGVVARAVVGLRSRQGEDRPSRSGPSSGQSRGGGGDRGVDDGLTPGLHTVVRRLDDGDAAGRAAFAADGERALGALRRGPAVNGDRDGLGQGTLRGHQGGSGRRPACRLRVGRGGACPGGWRFAHSAGSRRSAGGVAQVIPSQTMPRSPAAGIFAPIVGRAQPHGGSNQGGDGPD